MKRRLCITALTQGEHALMCMPALTRKNARDRKRTEMGLNPMNRSCHQRMPKTTRKPANYANKRTDVTNFATREDETRPTEAHEAVGRPMTGKPVISSPPHFPQSCRSLLATLSKPVVERQHALSSRSALQLCTTACSVNCARECRQNERSTTRQHRRAARQQHPSLSVQKTPNSSSARLLD